jgi:hypothetical protein
MNAGVQLPRAPSNGTGALLADARAHGIIDGAPYDGMWALVQEQRRRVGGVVPAAVPPMPVPPPVPAPPSTVASPLGASALSSFALTTVGIGFAC